MQVQPPARAEDFDEKAGRSYRHSLSDSTGLAKPNVFLPGLKDLASGAFIATFGPNDPVNQLTEEEVIEEEQRALKSPTRRRARLLTKTETGKGSDWLLASSLFPRHLQANNNGTGGGNNNATTATSTATPSASASATSSMNAAYTGGYIIVSSLVITSDALVNAAGLGLNASATLDPAQVAAHLEQLLLTTPPQVLLAAFLNDTAPRLGLKASQFLINASSVSTTIATRPFPAAPPPPPSNELYFIIGGAGGALVLSLAGLAGYFGWKIQKIKKEEKLQKEMAEAAKKKQAEEEAKKKPQPEVSLPTRKKKPGKDQWSVAAGVPTGDGGDNAQFDGAFAPNGIFGAGRLPPFASLLHPGQPSASASSVAPAPFGNLPPAIAWQEQLRRQYAGLYKEQSFGGAGPASVLPPVGITSSAAAAATDKKGKGKVFTLPGRRGGGAAAVHPSPLSSRPGSGGQQQQLENSTQSSGDIDNDSNKLLEVLATGGALSKPSTPTEGGQPAPPGTAPSALQVVVNSPSGAAPSSSSTPPTAGGGTTTMAAAAPASSPPLSSRPSNKVVPGGSTTSPATTSASLGAMRASSRRPNNLKAGTGAAAVAAADRLRGVYSDEHGEAEEHHDADKADNSGDDDDDDEEDEHEHSNHLANAQEAVHQAMRTMSMHHPQAAAAAAAMMMQPPSPSPFMPFGPMGMGGMGMGMGGPPMSYGHSFAPFMYPQQQKQQAGRQLAKGSAGNKAPVTKSTKIVPTQGKAGSKPPMVVTEEGQGGGASKASLLPIETLPPAQQRSEKARRFLEAINNNSNNNNSTNASRMPPSQSSSSSSAAVQAFMSFSAAEAAARSNGGGRGDGYDADEFDDNTESGAAGMRNDDGDNNEAEGAAGTVATSASMREEEMAAIANLLGLGPAPSSPSPLLKPSSSPSNAFGKQQQQPQRPTRDPSSNATAVNTAAADEVPDGLDLTNATGATNATGIIDELMLVDTVTTATGVNAAVMMTSAGRTGTNPGGPVGGAGPQLRHHVYRNGNRSGGGDHSPAALTVTVGEDEVDEILNGLLGPSDSFAKASARAGNRISASDPEAFFRTSSSAAQQTLASTVDSHANNNMNNMNNNDALSAAMLASSLATPSRTLLPPLPGSTLLQNHSPASPMAASASSTTTIPMPRFASSRVDDALSRFQQSEARVQSLRARATAAAAAGLGAGLGAPSSVVPLAFGGGGGGGGASSLMPHGLVSPASSTSSLASPFAGAFGGVGRPAMVSPQQQQQQGGGAALGSPSASASVLRRPGSASLRLTSRNVLGASSSLSVAQQHLMGPDYQPQQQRPSPFGAVSPSSPPQR